MLKKGYKRKTPIRKITLIVKALYVVPDVAKSPHDIALNDIARIASRKYQNYHLKPHDRRPIFSYSSILKIIKR